ncbi:hypothetical protein TRP8649_02328 [Pelagimonas phthalicica]|uniref:TIR domain-containing protein n=1 Tax=Pelagimonas phthalicica TaxID=1037362 RepID=A0A238JCV3_9RHOB|nr:toll/interleukin-1 receptor domain-containing protein [Pelagimonas phthalicica]TDS91166.1 TIR domain-containing protein [Pelagimonas phthalicica]SMX28213.1 hypothetical protein TRP8649_02328 [Pelagimonas phthalicica]
MQVFISYRRSDTQSVSETIYSRLGARLGNDEVFMDFGSLNPGERFKEVTLPKLEQAQIVFCVVGCSWEETLRERARQELFDPLAEEIKTAIELEKTIIPILVDRESQPLSVSDIPSSIKSLEELNSEHLRTSSLLPDLDNLLRRLTFSYPRVFGQSLAPVLLEEETMRRLKRVPFFSDGTIVPCEQNEQWERSAKYEFGGSPSDDFRFEVHSGNRKEIGICFFNGYDDVTEVLLGQKDGVARGAKRIEGVRSQYGFFWPDYYFTVCGGYGARDYYWSGGSLGLAWRIWDWVFLRTPAETSDLRGEEVNQGCGVARRSKNDQDVILFNTGDTAPVKYYRSFNGLGSHVESDQAARGTYVQWSQRGGGYRDFSFVLKDRLRLGSDPKPRSVYFGQVTDRELSVTKVDLNAREELYAHPSGVPILVNIDHKENLSFEIFGNGDANSEHTDTTQFDGLGAAGWPNVSFCRDGRTVAFEQLYAQQVVIADLFSGSIISILQGCREPVFSPDGERLLVLKHGSQFASVCSKFGENLVELGPVRNRRSIQFGYLSNDHFDIVDDYCWDDTGNRVLLLHAAEVNVFELKK